MPDPDDLLADSEFSTSAALSLPTVKTDGDSREFFVEQSFFDSRSIFGLSKMTVADGEIIFAAIVTRQSIESATIEADLLF